MTCREFTEFLDAYLRGDLSPAERDEFERHLGVCSACVNYMKSYRDTIQLGKLAFTDVDASLPEDVPDDLVRAILAARQRRG
jgi:anti-sigma factor RsiW